MYTHKKSKNTLKAKYHFESWNFMRVAAATSAVYVLYTIFVYWYKFVSLFTGNCSNEKPHNQKY